MTARSPSTPFPRPSGDRLWDGSSRATRSTSSRRSGSATRSAVTTSRGTSTASAASGGEDVRVWVDAVPELLRYLVEKGSVTVEGVALTVTEVDEGGFAVALVPHTLAETTLASLAAGDPVNLEVDVLAKYVERLLPGLRSSA